jgi:hypothetical protein
MPKSLADQLLDEAATLTRLACATTGEESERAFERAQDCRYYASKAALRALRKGSAGYAAIAAEMEKSSKALEEADKALAKLGAAIAEVAAALDAVARLIVVIVGVLSL